MSKMNGIVGTPKGRQAARSGVRMLGMGLTLALLLAGCGQKGPLTPPPPPAATQPHR